MPDQQTNGPSCFLKHGFCIWYLSILSGRDFPKLKFATIDRDDISIVCQLFDIFDDTSKCLLTTTTSMSRILAQKSLRSHLFQKYFEILFLAETKYNYLV